MLFRTIKLLHNVLRTTKRTNLVLEQRRTFIRWKKEKAKFKWFDDCKLKECKESPKCTQEPEFLRKIKMKIVEGGTNFGTPFRRVTCPVQEDPKPSKPAVQQPKPEEPEQTDGVQITLLASNTIVGQNLAILLKQVPEVKRLYLYELEKTQSAVAITNDDSPTHCLVRSFGTTWCDLEMCLQNSDIVVFLETFHVHPEMTVEKRFYYQAPIVKRFTEAIAGYCPQAFLLVCTTPIECMVPLVAELMNEYGWYNPCKIMGCVAPLELRASNLAAQALGLDPCSTRVPCICGTEASTLVPLYSRTVDQFEVYEHDAKHLTEVLRMAPISEFRAAGGLAHSARMCEAQAIASVVLMITHSLLYNEVWRLSGFIDTTYSIITPSRFIANTLELGYSGITRCFDIPKLSDYEMSSVDIALMEMRRRRMIMEDWYCKYCCCWDKCVCAH